MEEEEPIKIGPGLKESDLSPKSSSEEKNYLLVADPHYERRADGELYEEVRELNDLVEEYDCEGLLVAGDIGYSWTLQKLLDVEVPEKKVIGGNHDQWTHGALESLNLLSPDGEREDVDFSYPENTLDWEEEVGGDKYKILMKHKAQDGVVKSFFDTKVKGNPDSFWADLLVHGHTHIPWTRVLEGGILAVGAGSLLKNTRKFCNWDYPDRSAHVLSLNSEVGLRHIDFDKKEIFEKKTFEKKNGSFRLKSEYRGN